MALIDSLKKIQQEKQTEQDRNTMFSSLEEMKNRGMMDMQNMARAEMANMIRQIKADMKAEMNVGIKNVMSKMEEKMMNNHSKMMLDMQRNLKDFITASIPAPAKPDIDQVKGLRELLDNLSNRIKNIKGGRGGGGSTLRVDNLSSQADGSTKTFTTTYRIGSAHLLFYSSFPSLFLPTTDYTVSGNTVTLGSSVTAPASGQSLAIFYESAD